MTDTTRRSRDPIPALLALSLGYFSMGTASLAVVGLNSPIGTDLNVEPAHVGFLVTVFALTFAVAAPLAPAVLGRWDRKQTLVIGLILLTGGAVVSALAPDYWTLTATRMVAALGAAILGPAASATASLLVRPEHRNRALAIVFSGMTIAAVLGVPLASYLGSTIGWRAALLVVAALAALALALVGALVPRLPGGEPSPARAYRAALRTPGAMPTIATTLLFMAAQFTLYGIAGAFLTDRFGASDTVVSMTLLAFGLVGVVGTVSSAPFADRLGGGRTVTLALIGLAGGFVLLLIAPHATAGLFLFVLWAFFSQLYQAPQQGRLVTLLPDQPGLILALNASALYLGMSLGSTIGGAALPPLGADPIPLLALLLVAGAGAAHVASCRHSRTANPSPTS